MRDPRFLLWASMLVAGAVAPLPAAQDPRETPFKQALALYRQNRLTEALPFFEQASASDSTNPTTLAWFAETLRRLEKVDSAVIVARRAVALSPCNAFAHQVIGNAYHPWFQTRLSDYDSLWVHLSRAVACDPNDGNGWLTMWGEALRRGDRAVEEKALRRLIETGFFSRTTLAYNRWILRIMPPNAIVLTDGDLDTYPALSLQVTEGLRPDVAIVNVSMLYLWWYVETIHARFGLPLPADSERLAKRPACGTGGADTVCSRAFVLLEWRRQMAQGALQRPIAVAFEDDLPEGPGVFVRTGPLLVLRADSAFPLDTAAMARSLRGLRGRDFADPSVSPRDRSAIRIASDTEKGLPLRVENTAVIYGRELVRVGRLAEARDLLDWLRRFMHDAALDTPRAREMLAGFTGELESAAHKP